MFRLQVGSVVTGMLCLAAGLDVAMPEVSPGATAGLQSMQPPGRLPSWAATLQTPDCQPMPTASPGVQTDTPTLPVVSYCTKGYSLSAAKISKNSFLGQAKLKNSFIVKSKLSKDSIY